MKLSIFVALFVFGVALFAAGLRVFFAGAYVSGVMLCTGGTIFGGLVFSAWRESRRAVWR